MINPSGAILTRIDLEKYLLTMFGARPNVKISITKPNVIIENNDSCVLLYEEIQHMEYDKLHRISTAVFIRNNNRVLWRHLHETWAQSNSNATCKF